MINSFTESVEKALKAGFDPEGTEYNEVIGGMLKKKYPLRIPKPPIPDDPTEEITVAQPEEKYGYAHEAWVWHPKEKDWFKHQASFDPVTRRLLKGMTHGTIGKTLAGEKDFSEIYKGKDGYYYRRPLEND